MSLETEAMDNSENQASDGAGLHMYAWITAGFFTLFATMLSLYLIYKHFRNYTQPHLQRYVVRILLMVPIYAIDSLLSLIFRQYALYFDLLRDCYEAYVLWLFFTLLVNYLNGSANLEAILEEKPLTKHPFPTCFLPKFKPGVTFLRWCKLCVLQFTIIKPLSTFVALILQIKGLYGDGHFSPHFGYLYLTVIDNISITISMYFLVLFYLSTKEELTPFHAIPKFLCIKAIIFFSFWQGVIIALLAMLKVFHDVGPFTVEQIVTGAQDFLICVEMFIVSIFHIKVFGYYQFHKPGKVPFLHSILSGKIKETALPLLQNFGDVVNPRHDYEYTIDTLNQAPIFSPFDRRKLETLPLLSEKEEMEVDRRNHFGDV